MTLALSPAVMSGVILLFTLMLFASERVRHDLVAVLALLASVAAGLVKPKDALSGFADPAVIAVAAVLVVGRALELTGVAGAITARLMPQKATFPLRMAVLLVAGAFLSAFMNNIAALVITMPIATEIARSSRKPPGAILMPLAFATILGGMTTLIGTPANLIISSVRERELGSGFGFFAMTPVASVVTVLGIAYVAVLGWRLLPQRSKVEQTRRRIWMTFELTVRERPGIERKELGEILRKTGSRLIGQYRDGRRIDWPTAGLDPGDRLLLLSRTDPWLVDVTLPWASSEHVHATDTPVARVSVAHGSPLIGRGYGAIPYLSEHRLHVVAAGPRAAMERTPPRFMEIRAGDQLFIEGNGEELARFAGQMRLLEIDRFDRQNVRNGKAYGVVGIFIAAILAIVLGGASPAISFLAAAAMIAGLRLVPAKEVYTSIDWSIVVLLAAMIPVGGSFESSGAAAIAADYLGDALAGQSLQIAIGTMCLVTMILSIFLNNVATALVMAPLGIRLAELLHVSPDAMLLAVLIGASSDFLTPIGHQNNLLVMGPGGYRFGDYIRMGAAMSTLVVVVTALFLARQYG